MKTTPKIIATESEYDLVLAEIEALAELDPAPDTPEGERLDLLVLLVQNYEAATCERSIPDPIDAILFRMEQQQLAPRDLVSYIGSRSKVSEVLARKRPLTLSMIRALHTGLGIPAVVLLQPSQTHEEESQIEWERFPLKEMVARGWVSSNQSGSQPRATDILRPFFNSISNYAGTQVLYRKTDHVRSGRTMDEYALKAWTARIIQKAQEDPPAATYKPETVTPTFIHEVAQLSWSEQGPLLAREYLKNYGISLVIEPHLSGTYLDGAAIMIQPDHPIIGLTLRFDRIDNFWFTLAHELAHIALHANSETDRFYDDLETEGKDVIEREADELAAESLIPKEEWIKSPASKLKLSEAAEHLARKLRIHPAIVAGRMRHTFNNYRILNNLVGHNQVRRCFSEIQW